MDTSNRFDYSYLDEEMIAPEVKTIADSIYKAHLPPYLQESWQKGRGKWYEDSLREQLHTLVISEVYDSSRLAELEHWQNEISLIFGILGAAFRILDHIGMHLRGQTLGQYELLPEDEELLRGLCKRFLKARRLDLNPFDII